MDWWLKKTDLRKSFFVLLLLCLVVFGTLGALIYVSLENGIKSYPSAGSIIILPGGEVLAGAQPTEREQMIQTVLRALQGITIFLFPALTVRVSGWMFYRWKLKPPIDALLSGMERVRNQDLDFTIPEISGDELGQVCAAFETMRSELLRTNQELWRQAEERRRLNAAFAHDLRNPVTVLKGTVKQLRRGTADEGALDRLEVYTERIERYIEAMSSVQRLEQLPVERKPVALSLLRQELEETVKLLAPELALSLSIPEEGMAALDHGLFLTVAENLIGNAARFGCSELMVSLALEGDILRLTVTDDGPGFSAELLKSGPRPFGRAKEEVSHFGMGLYSSQLLCRKHGGDLRLENRPGGMAEASFATVRPAEAPKKTVRA